MQREDAAVVEGVSSSSSSNSRIIHNDDDGDMVLSSRDRRPCRGWPRRWTLLTPTVLLSVVILAMTPSFYGFAGGLGGLPTGRSTAGTRGVAAADLASAGSSGAKGRQGGDGGGATGSAKGSPFAAASWLKERVRDGKRRVQMQVGVCQVPTFRYV